MLLTTQARAILHLGSSNAQGQPPRLKLSYFLSIIIMTVEVYRRFFRSEKSSVNVNSLDPSCATPIEQEPAEAIPKS